MEVTVCRNCEKPKPLKAKGVCSNCYNKANKHRWDNRNECPIRKRERYRKRSWAQRVLKGGGSNERRLNLSVKYLQDLQEQHPVCECCSVGLDFHPHSSGGDRPTNLATLDKVVPSLGYVVGNVAVLCWTCNRNKRDMTSDTLRQLLSYVERKTFYRVKASA